MDGILGNTFPFHAKWEILMELAILREKFPKYLIVPFSL